MPTDAAAGPGGEAARIQVPPSCDLTLGMVCRDKAQPGRGVWQMVADERFANPAGVVQGGFLAAFADSAMGAAVLTWARDRAGGGPVRSANAELKVSFLRPVRVGSTLTCSAQVLSGGKRAAFAEAEVTDDDGRLVAKASSTYLVGPR
ncbi:MAG: PaaI family thioesterase [Acidimicrobiales bacterium]